DSAVQLSVRHSGSRTTQRSGPEPPDLNPWGVAGAARPESSRPEPLGLNPWGAVRAARPESVRRGQSRPAALRARSEERRVGKECRARGGPEHEENNREEEGGEGRGAGRHD